MFTNPRRDIRELLGFKLPNDLVNKVLRAGNNHEKEYLVTVNKPITDSFIEGMAGGVPILGQMTKKCPVTRVAPTVFNITLVQGLNRQIRRMCEHFGYEVVKLERTRIMNVNLKGLAIGDWRDLTQKEMSVLLKSIEGSASEDSNASKKSTNTRRKKSNNNRSSQSKGTKENSKRSKNGGKDPAVSKGGRPFGRGKTAGGKSAGGKNSAGNGKRPAKGRGSKRSSRK